MDISNEGISLVNHLFDSFIRGNSTRRGSPVSLTYEWRGGDT